MELELDSPGRVDDAMDDRDRCASMRHRDRPLDHLFVAKGAAVGGNAPFNSGLAAKLNETTEAIAATQSKRK